MENDSLRTVNKNLTVQRQDWEKKVESLEKVSKKYLDVSNSQTEKISTFKKEFEKIKKEHIDNNTN